jgi:hypothetical protein
MNKPKIEKQIAKQGKDLIKYSSFITLGVSSLSAIMNLEPAIVIPFLTVTISTGAFLIGTDAWAIKGFLNDRKKFKSELLVYKPIFKEKFNAWLANYLNESQNLTEKKYKLIFLSLWAKHKEIPLENLFDKSQILRISDELINKGETSHSIWHMFFEPSSLLRQVSNSEVTPIKFLDEDQKYPKKITIAKNIHEEFAEMGLAAKAFITGIDCSFLLEIQEFKFNETDYKFIKKFINDFENSEKEIYPIKFINPYSDNTINTLHKVIDYENNWDNLMLLDNYFKLIDKKDYTKYMDQIPKIKKIFNNKLDYIKLNEELNNSDSNSNSNSNSNIKKNKNKI